MEIHLARFKLGMGKSYVDICEKNLLDTNIKLLILMVNIADVLCVFLLLDENV